MIILKYYNYASKKRHVMLIPSCSSIRAAKICAVFTTYSINYLGDSQVEGRRIRSSLDDGRSSKDVGVGQVSGHVLGQEDVALTRDHWWNGSHDHAVLNACGLNWDDVQAGYEGGVEVTRWHGSWLNVNHGVLGGGLARDESKDWVRLDWKGHVGRWAGSDEAAGDGVDSVEAERSSKDVGHWDLADGTAGSRLVKCLGDQDAAGGSEVCLGSNVCRSAEVC